MRLQPRQKRVCALFVFLISLTIANLAPAAAEEEKAAPKFSPQARALELSIDIRSQTENIAGFLFSPKVTSAEIEALRKKSISYDLLLSREMSEADRKRLEGERETVNQELRTAVNDHPTVRAAAAELEANKVKLAALFQEIKEQNQRRSEQQADQQNE